MDNPKKDKIKHQFTPAEAADYLRQLADALERGHIALSSEDFELEGEVKVKQEMKTKSGKATLKIKLKIVAPVPPEMPEQCEGVAEITPEGAEGEAAAEDEPAAEEELPSYKKVKKSMSKTFNALKNLRKQQNLPSADEVAAFTALARQMCAFEEEKYGSEQFPRFLAALEQLESAVAAGEAQAIDEALVELTACRTDCHKAFK